MSPITSETLLSQLNWRYATKLFDPSRKISAADWETLEESLLLSPSSYGLELWRFYVVHNRETRAALRVHSWDQAQVVEASHLVVFASKQNVEKVDIEKLITRIQEVRDQTASALEGYKSMMMQNLIDTAQSHELHHWTAKQVYLALGFLLSSAALLGIDACPMEGIDATQYDQLLGISEDGFRTTVVCALGYRAKGDPHANLKKVRYPLSDIVRQVK